VEGTSSPLSHRREILALTGLRFVAAFSVVVAHGADVTFRVTSPSHLFELIKFWLSSAAGIGMPLFFVLSGFVIHYNYRTLITAKGVAGFANFLWARFSRLYPLFAIFLIFDVLLGERTYTSVAGDRADILSALKALPYFLTFTQSWIYSIINDQSLLFRIGNALPVTWSISTEWFFYLCYPLIMLFIMRIDRPLPVIGCAIAWTLVWGAFAYQVAVHAGGLDAWAARYFGVSAAQSYTQQDDFIRWLLYYSPYLRVGEFTLGCIAAQLYLVLERGKPSHGERAIALFGMVIGVGSIPAIMYMMYVPGSEYWVRRLNNNFGLAPSLAILLFCAARYEFSGLRWLSMRPIVRLGEASYSIYLTHMLVFLIVAGSNGPLPANLGSYVYLYARLIAMVALVLFLSNGIFVWIEDPARRLLRGLWQEPISPIMSTTIICGVMIPAVVVVALNGLILVRSERSLQSSGVQIESATYGASCGAAEGNASLRVQSACQGRSVCAYVVNVQKLGDPAPGCAKDFAVAFTCAPHHKLFRRYAPGEAGMGTLINLNCGTSGDPK
jgi:peptidoglycan/LPS O-acetylase OafA/YrhL